MEEEEKKVVPTYELNRRNNRPKTKGYSIQELWNNQIGPNFIERYRNRELGKDKADQILRGLEETWDSLGETHQNNIITLGNTIGDIYQNLRTSEGAELLNPISNQTAAAIRAGEFALNTVGAVSDFTLGNLGRGAGWLAGLDPRWREGLAIGAQLYLGPKAIRGVSKIQPKHLGIKQSISKIAPLDDAVPYTKKLINITDDSKLLNIVDDAFKYDIETISKARLLYKHHPDAGWKTALAHAQQFKGITNQKFIKEFTSGSLRKNSLFSPNYRPPNLMFKEGDIPTDISKDQPPKKSKLPPKITTNEKIKQSLLNDEAIILNPTYRGGKITVRDEADFFDVSAAIIGPGQEIKKDSKGRKIPYDRKGVTEFGSTKSAQRDKIYKHLQTELGAKNITRTEFNRYAKEQIEAEKDLRKAIKLLNLRAYAAEKNIDLSNYPTKEAQLEFLNKINKAKRNKTDYLDYRETFDYGHIISAKTGFRIEDLGMNRISNTEIEASHNIVSRDRYTQKIIEVLQEGNRERGSRRDFIPEVQQLRNSAGSVAEDFIKWKSNQPGAEGPNLYKILDKFIPREQHENYLRFVQKKFYENRQVAGSFKSYLESDIGIPYERYKTLGSKLQRQLRRAYVKEVEEAGIVIGRQQYDQAYGWMMEAIDEFIGLHHLHKDKRVRSTKEAGSLYDIEDLMPRDIETLLDMILPDSIND